MSDHLAKAKGSLDAASSKSEGHRSELYLRAAAQAQVAQAEILQAILERTPAVNPLTGTPNVQWPTKPAGYEPPTY